MTTLRNFRRITRAATAAVVLAVPVMANAAVIDLSGTINNVIGFGTPGFAVGDAVSGSFSVDPNTANSFDANDLDFFNFAVGANQFNLDGNDFVNFSGSLSANGSTVDAFSFLTGFTQATNGSQFALAFDLDNQPFAITAFTGVGEAPLSANVPGVAVPEPRALGVPGFAMTLLGLGIFVRRRHSG